MDLRFAPETWPEHAEELRSIIFGQSVLRFYKDSPVVTTSGADATQISELAMAHPLNTAKERFSEEQCGRLWRELVPDPSSDTVLLAELKLQLLRQVKLYIEKSFRVMEATTPKTEVRETLTEMAETSKQSLRSDSQNKPEYSVEQSGDSMRQSDSESTVQPTPKEDLKAQEASELATDAKSQPDQGQLAEADSQSQTLALSEPDAHADLGAQVKSPSEQLNAAKEKPIEPSAAPSGETEGSNLVTAGDHGSEIETKAHAAPTETPSEVPISEGVDSAKDSSAEPDSKLDSKEAESKRKLAEPESGSHLTPTEERIARRRTRTRRSRRSTPEPEAVGAETERIPAPQQLGADESPPEPDHDDAEPTPEPESEEPTPAGPVQPVGPEEPEASRDPRKRKRSMSVTTDSTESSPAPTVQDDSPLAQAIQSLLGKRRFSFFRTPPPPSEAVRTDPVDLPGILQGVHAGAITTMEQALAELFRMIANAVVAQQVSSSDAAKLLPLVDSALETVAPPAANPPARETKRRRR